MQATARLLVITLLLGMGLRLQAGDVSISAAASLRETLTELCDSYAKSHPGVVFVKSFAGSGTLARQLEAGAPADLFLSADLAWMDYLKERRLVEPSSIATFATNTLVFVGARGRAASLQDLPKLEKIAIGSPRSVPAGEYAMEALRHAGLDRQLDKKLVMAKDVRECLMYAERGEVDGAFVYATDALQTTKANLLFTVPQNLYSRVVYPMALTSAGSRKPEAVAFFSLLHTPEARAVLAKHGFPLQ